MKRGYGVEGGFIKAGEEEVVCCEKIKELRFGGGGRVELSEIVSGRENVAGEI